MFKGLKSSSFISAGLIMYATIN